jgi:AhpD family alkylhydroperoxidase
VALTVKEKELVNIGASVATGCRPCTDYHFKKLRAANACDKEIEQAITDAMTVRDSARTIMESHGLKHLGIEKPTENGDSVGETTRIKELVSVGAAFAVNCTANLEKHMAAARAVGITEDEIRSVLDAAAFIKGEAQHYVDQIAKLEEKNVELQQLLQELKETQALLVQSEKMAALGKLVAGVVHELNTPVGAINSAADVSARSVERILRALETDTKRAKGGNNRSLRNSLKALKDSGPAARAASERISRIVEGLKSFTSLDEAELKKIDIQQGLESTLTLLEHELSDRITVVKEYEDIPAITGNAAELNQVFMHLLTNAAHAIPKKGTITIRTCAADGSIRIEITDTGVGIPPDKVKGLFEPGFSHTESRVKAGFGLFTSYNIIRKHQGCINVTSRVGRGSTFTVSLPVELGKEAVAADEDSSIDDTSRCDQLSKASESDEPASRCDRLS